jgi:stage II sporulation protein D
VTVARRDDAGRAERIGIKSGKIVKEVRGEDFREVLGRAFGARTVRSTRFEINSDASGVTFSGRGFGHGVGLCVVGAGARSAGGASADSILRFYFPSLTIGRAGAATATATAGAPATMAPAAMATPAAKAPVTTDVQLLLPAAEEGERSALVGLIRQAREAASAATGRKPPAVIRVTVHSSVEAFGRATGQPWWSAGATAAGAIDLLPITLLRQQGQLERTVRHEMVHALIDGALASKPMWVREGAAIYFSRSPAVGRQPVERVPCPSDAELLRPISAGAQRDAYARAEACFARQINSGRRWEDVR